MRRDEALEAQVGELQRELRDLLDEYVEVQERLRALESVTGCETTQAGERAVADLPERLQRVAEATDADTAATDTDDEGDASHDAATTCASQAEVAAAVERVEESEEEAEVTEGPEETADSDDAATDDEGLDDIIIG
ncbi:DUF7518 family protein [Halomarina oriensis]|uniref:Uncharacterized protein n=1 Tax=Halomarina oriensis TaxID=671145 RepID=A0A6B0GRW0_9EURY|nr:hypothetical protein [Halomarina oriensis]MWG36409.1 hypothetical protein [Halomarina oriensis]